MTNREFFVNVGKGIVTEVEMAHAQAQLTTMDEANAKNRGKESKTYKENIPLFAEVLALLTEKPMLTTEIALAMSTEERPISNSKASGLLRTLENEGKVVQTKVKVKGKGKVMGYSLARAENADDSADSATDDGATE